MCTCGIDIATQQATPAMHSSACAAPSERPNGRVASRPAPPRRRPRPPAPAAGARMNERQQRHRRGAEDADADVGLAPADGLDEVLHDRRPDRAGEVVAAGADRHRDAAPARRTRARCRRPAARRSPSCRAGRSAGRARARRPRMPPRQAGERRSRAPRPTAPISTGTITPKRSASRPMRMPPMPKPIIISV